MSNLVDLANRGRPLSEARIIDSHAHMGPYRCFHIPYSDPEGMIVAMDALGIETCIVGANAGIGPDFRRGNDIARKAALDFPGRFLGAICLNPNYPQSIVSEIERFDGSGVMKAIKLHPSAHDYPADGEHYRTVYEVAGKKGLPVTTHTWFGDKRCSPKMYGELGREYPETKFVLIHSGGTRSAVGEAVEAARSSDNVWLDTTGSMTFRTVELLVEALGSKRIVFGSDTPFIDPIAQVGKIVYAPISEEAKLDILGRNARELFGLASPSQGQCPSPR